jgi:3'(2'), 5'-bisphosphate nucleotidase
MTPDTRDDAGVATDLARRAGELLLELRDSGRFSGDALKDAGDARSNDFLLGELAGLRPDDAVLSEEGAADPRRSSAARVWIIDPLDGTREYAEHGPEGWRDDWAVHVALWDRSADDLIAGAVALPARGVVFGTHPAPPAPEPGARVLRLAVSRSRPPGIVQRLAAEFPVELVPMGSAGVKAMAVVTGEVDAYVHAGGQYEWDSAAPVAVALAAGLSATRIDGSRLTYNNPNPWSPDLVMCRAGLAEQIAGWIASVGTDEEGA